MRKKATDKIFFSSAAIRIIPYENYPAWVSSRILQNSVRRDNGCIEYGGGKLKHRYGLISLTLIGKHMRVPAHRALWMAVHRDFSLPRGVYIRHKCDNPCCVNIDHLESGTPKDNMQDCLERGRRARTYKPHVRECKIPNDTIRAILAEPDGMKVRHISNKYGISNSYASKLRSGKAKALLRLA